MPELEQPQRDAFHPQSEAAAVKLPNALPREHHSECRPSVGAGEHARLFGDEDPVLRESRIQACVEALM